MAARRIENHFLVKLITPPALAVDVLWMLLTKPWLVTTSDVLHLSNSAGRSSTGGCLYICAMRFDVGRIRKWLLPVFVWLARLGRKRAQATVRLATTALKLGLALHMFHAGTSGKPASSCTDETRKQTTAADDGASIDSAATCTDTDKSLEARNRLRWHEAITLRDFLLDAKFKQAPSSGRMLSNWPLACLPCLPLSAT